jgi:hypothetical protein
VPVLEDLEEVAALLIAQRREAPVVEHQDVDLRQPTEQARVRAVGVCQGQLLQKPRQPPVESAEAGTARLLREDAREVRLSPCRSLP